MKKYTKKLLINLPPHFLEKVQKADFVGVDTETISLVDKTMIGFSIAFNKESYYFPVTDKVLDNMPIKQAQELLQFILDKCITVFHTSAFDLPVLDKFGIDIYHSYEIHDILLIANLVNENIRHGLKKLAKKYLKYIMTELKEHCGTGKKWVSFAEAPKKNPEGKLKFEYPCDDAWCTLELFDKLMDRLKKDLIVENVYTQIEQPLLHVIANMHSNGITIDVKKVKEIRDKCEHIVELAEVKLKIEMGDEVNFGSTQQLKKYFIDERHMPIIKQSEKTGRPSMDKEVLTKYAETNSVAKTLLEFRKYSKILSTFIPALLPDKMGFSGTIGKIYANFNQVGTTSGRFSSSRPNMQNIPRADEEENIKIREAIVADSGEILIGADYSQIELRVLAHFSRDPNLVKAYDEDKDIHQQTADACGCSRYDAKTVNFGLVYGMGSKTLAKKIKVSQEEAQQYIDRYFETYSKVKEFWAETEKSFKNLGYVETLSGRKKRRSDNFDVKDSYDQGAEMRSATNAIIQGSAADLIKMAMIAMYPQLQKYGARIISTVHDEILVSSPIKTAKQVYAVVQRSMMEASSGLSVPVKVSCKFGRSWEEAHGDGIKLEEFKNA